MMDLNKLELAMLNYTQNPNEQSSLELLALLESGALSLRNEIIFKNDKAKSTVKRIICDNFNVNITYNNGILDISLPRLLPRKTDKTRYIFTTLEIAIREKLENKEVNTPKFTKGVIVKFTHYYSEEDMFRITDYDNLETKSALDIIGLYFLEDDSPKNISTYHTMKIGDKTYTRIQIIDDNFMKNIVDI